MVILYFSFIPNGCQSTIRQGGFAKTHPERMMPATSVIYTTLSARCRRDLICAIHLGGSATDTQFLQYIISLARGWGGRLSRRLPSGRTGTCSSSIGMFRF